MDKSFKEQVPVVIAFTPDYLVTAATFITSLLSSSNDDDRFHTICLLSESPTEEMKGHLMALDDRVEFEFINAAGLLSDIYIDPVFTEAASYRLLLPTLLPAYDKVIYMDCDIIVRNNMAELFRSIDLGANYLAAVFEATLSFQEEYVLSLGCHLGQYFNSGVLIMNLDQMRKDSMVPLFLDASKESGLMFPDQDVLNRTCKGKTMGLAPFYNGVRTFLLPQYKSDFLKYYTESDWKSIQSHGNLHYTGGKPWKTFTVKFDEWWKYYEKLPSTIKKSSVVNNKMYLLYRLYCVKLFRIIISNARSFYRKVRYGG